MYGGRTNDEATRWACLDSSPEVIMSGFTMKPLSHEEFNLLFEVRLVRSHTLHEYTRLFEGELIRLCMRTHHGDEEQQKRYKQLDKAVRNAKSNSKRRKARDEGYEESARGKSNVKRPTAGAEGYEESARGKISAALEAPRLQRDLEGRARRGASYGATHAFVLAETSVIIKAEELARRYNHTKLAPTMSRAPRAPSSMTRLSGPKEEEEMI